MQSETADLQRAIQAVQVRFGEQALVRAGRLPAPTPWPTGLAAVDRLSGIGGLPYGRVCVLSGGPGSGKLSLGLALLAQATRGFAQAVVIDPLGGFDPWMLAALGGELAPLTAVRPPGADPAGEAAVALARAGAGFLLVLGSLPEPALAPLEAAAARSGCVLVSVSEAPERGLAYASSLTLELVRTGWVRQRGELVGLRVRVLCVKNKLAAPGATAGLEIHYPLGGASKLATISETSSAEADRAAQPDFQTQEVEWQSAAV